MVIDAIGRNQKSSNFGTLWSEDEIRLLDRLVRSISIRGRVVVEYRSQASQLGYPARSKQALYSRIERHFPGRKTRFLWSEEEDSKLVEMLDDYPFALAAVKYQMWARQKGYPTRSLTALRTRVDCLGSSTIDPMIVAGVGTISRSLGLAPGTIAKLIKKSEIKTKLVGRQRVTCKVDDFFHWFASSGAWIDTLGNITCGGYDKPDLYNWSLLLNISLSQLESEWRKAQDKIIKVCSPLSGNVLRVNDFAKQNQISSNAIRVAIRKGRNEVSGVTFEVLRGDKISSG